MKKLLFIVFILFVSISIFGASIGGNVKIDNGDSLGIFVYVEGQNKYDITDSKGRFNITGLQTGKEYTLVFQKGTLRDYKKTFKLSGENLSVNVLIPSETKSEVKEKVIAKTSDKETDTKTKNTDVKKVSTTKTKVSTVKSESTKTELNQTGAVKAEKEKVVMSNLSGKINSVLTGNVFLQLSGHNYGYIIKPNSTFKISLIPGKYTGTLIQDGAMTRKVDFTLSKTGTDFGIIELEALDYNELILNFSDKVENGVIQLYKDGYLEYSSKITKDSRSFVAKGIKKGTYNVVIKSFGKEDYTSNIVVNNNTVMDVQFNKINKENKVFVNIYPKDTETEVRIFDGNTLIRNIVAKDYLVLEGLDNQKTYSLETVDDKYKRVQINRVLVGDTVDIALAREIKGTFLNGYISPFNSGAKVMLLDNGQILAETTVDENGYYELEFSDKLNGEKNIRIIAENFDDIVLTENFDMNKSVYERNLTLLPFTTKLDGTVTFDRGDSLANVLVIIEELGIWQFTNSRGEYYFADLPEGEYEITFKKMGYVTKTEKVRTSKDEKSTKNIVLNAVGKIVFRSNLEAYKLTINGKEIIVNSKLYESVQGMGDVTVTAIKTGYLPTTVKIKLTEVGEIRDVIFDFINIEEQNNLVKNKIDIIKISIKELRIDDAEKALEELSTMKGLKSYEADYLDIKSKLRSAKLKLFDVDRSIKFEIEKVKENIKKSESSNLGYIEKNKNLTKMYKESVDYLEKVILSHPYTTYRYDIHMLQGDIYAKLGMPNSAKNSMEEAKKYEGRRKE